MTTLPVSQRGRLVQTRLGKVVTVGVLPTVWKPCRMYDVTAGMSRPLVKDDQMGVGVQNNRDATARRQGLPGGSLSRTVPLNLEEIPHWLSAGMTRVDAGTTGAYTHTFTTGAEPSDLLALAHQWSSGVFTWDKDVALASVRIQAQKDDTTARAQLSLIGLGDDGGGAWPTGTASSPYNPVDFSNWRWQGLWNDVLIGDLTNIDFTLDFGVERVQGLSGDEWPTRHHFGETNVSGSCRMYGQGEVLMALGAAATTGKFTMKATSPADTVNLFFKVDLPVTQFEKPQRTASGPGQMSASFNFAASQDASNPAVTIGVGNAVAAY